MPLSGSRIWTGCGSQFLNKLLCQAPQPCKAGGNAARVDPLPRLVQLPDNVTGCTALATRKHVAEYAPPISSDGSAAQIRVHLAQGARSTEPGRRGVQVPGRGCRVQTHWPSDSRRPHWREGGAVPAWKERGGSREYTSKGPAHPGYWMPGRTGARRSPLPVLPPPLARSSFSVVSPSRQAEGALSWSPPELVPAGPSGCAAAGLPANGPPPPLGWWAARPGRGREESLRSAAGRAGVD